MSKIFLTVVGTGNYQPTKYKLDDTIRENRFVQKALLEMLKEKGEKFDKLIFFLTTDAKSYNWETYTRHIKKCSGEEVTVTDEGLKPFLEKNFPDVAICDVHIPDGENKEELMEMFNAIYDSIEENDEITFDVTHGFRSIPFLFYPVMSYAKEMKGITIRNIFYGLFKPGSKNPAEIIDLKYYDEVLDCANAAHNFIRSGNSAEISEIADTLQKQVELTMSPDDKIRPGEVQTIPKGLNRLTDALLMCKGGAGRNAIRRSAAALNLKKKVLKRMNEPQFRVFRDLLVHALESVDMFGAEDALYQTGMKAVKWYKERNLFLQAYTALQETGVSFICRTYASEEDCIDKDFREQVINAAINGLIPHQDGKSISQEERMQTAVSLSRNPKYAKRGAAEVYIKIISHLKPEQLQFFSSIKEKRNYMNHFGMRQTELTPNEEDLENYYNMTWDLIHDIEERKESILSTEEARAVLDEYLLADSNVFVNFSNHPSGEWQKEQTDAALALSGGTEITDIPFPSVPADAGEEEIRSIAAEYAKRIIACRPAAVMCMGEFGVCVNVISQLQKKGIRVFYSCSERQSEENVTEFGSEKKSIFQFVRFREYPRN